MHMLDEELCWVFEETELEVELGAKILHGSRGRILVYDFALGHQK